MPVMECTDEEVERQKLVNDGETEIDDDQATITNVPASGIGGISSSGPKSTLQTPISPVMSAKVFSSGETSRSQNSTSCSLGKGTSDSAVSARLVYVNERKLGDAKGGDQKQKAKRIQRDESTPVQLKAPVPTLSCGPSFAARALKHHSFISEVPDVRHMERALLGLLDDFHLGKLRAFGSGCTMDQMTGIREQQERLAKLHFELGAGGDPHLMSNGAAAASGAGVAGQNAQENMAKLVQRLELLSVSIERLHSSNTQIG